MAVRKRQKLNPRPSGWTGRGPELKWSEGFSEVSYIPSTAGTADIFLDIGGMSSGAGVNQRVGYKATAKSLEIKLRLHRTSTLINGPGADTLRAGQFRIVVYRDNYTNSSNSSVTDVFEDPGGGVPLLDAFTKVAQEGRFNILFDKMLSIDREFVWKWQTDTLDPYPGVASRVCKGKIKLNDVIRYDGIAGGIGEMVGVSYHMGVLFNDCGHFTIKAQYRLRYTDF